MVKNGVKTTATARKRVCRMFMGEYNHTVDAKGRLIIPSRFREELKNEFIVTKGLDGCLFVFPGNEWQIFEEKLKALPLTNKNARQFSRINGDRTIFFLLFRFRKRDSQRKIPVFCVHPIFADPVDL